MRALRGLATIELVLGGLLMQGCGLLYIPVLREYRGPVKGVTAVDAETGKAIPDAKIRFILAKYDNWAIFSPRLVKVDEEPCRDGDSPEGIVVEGRRDGAVVHFEQKRLWGWTQCFFPIPLPLGWTRYHDHESTIAVTRNGYEGLMLLYHPAVPPAIGERFKPCGTAKSKAAAALADEGILVFELERTTRQTFLKRDSGCCPLTHPHFGAVFLDAAARAGHTSGRQGRPYLR